MVSALVFAAVGLLAVRSCRGFVVPVSKCHGRPVCFGSSGAGHAMSKVTMTSRHSPVFATSSEDSNETSDKIIDVSAETTDITPEEITRVEQWRQRLFPQQLPKGQRNPDEELPFRAKLAKLGLSVVLSYGWISNVFMTYTVSGAWFVFSKRTGKSPLAPGQWKPYLAVYAGFWVFNNFLRPFRVGISIAVSRYFDAIVEKAQERFKVKKGVAIGLTVFLANIVGTCALLFLNISLASILSGVPIWAR